MHRGQENLHVDQREEGCESSEKIRSIVQFEAVWFAQETKKWCSQESVRYPWGHREANAWNCWEWSTSTIRAG